MIIFGNPTENGDWIIGDDGDDWIYGAGGNDFLQGGGGGDLLLGNDGDDTFVPGLGVDFVYGGFLNGDSGNDTVSYALYGGAVLVDLSQGYGYLMSLGNADKDTLRGVENIGGSGYNDTLFGDTGANNIYGNSGNDAIDGNAGNDRLYGGSGDDHITGGTGADLIDGGTGIDTATYRGSSEGVFVNLRDNFGMRGEAEGDTFAGVENLVGSDYTDTLVGNAQANDLTGSKGDDTLVGFEGNDRLYGGLGKDAMIGGSGADQFIFQPVSRHAAMSIDTGKALSDADRIVDFSHAEGDKIDLSAVGMGASATDNSPGDKLTFTFIGQSGFSGVAGELRFMQAPAAGETRIMGDIDGDGAVDFRIVLNGIHELTAGDFVL